MVKNPIRMVRNPNSPQAIQQRLDGYQVTTPFEPHRIIDDTSGNIFIDLTKETVSQRVNFTPLGGPHFSRKLIRSSIMLDKSGRQVVTSYFVDSETNQWIIVRGYSDRPLPDFSEGSLGGFFGGVIGESWINEGRSVDEINETQKRVFNLTTSTPSQDQNIDIPPPDLREDDFTGVW